jgi:hypothetical protein
MTTLPFPSQAYNSLIGNGSAQYLQGAWTLQDTEIRCAVTYNTHQTLLFGGGQWGAPSSVSNGGHIYGYYNLAGAASIPTTAPAIECQMPLFDTAVDSMWNGPMTPPSSTYRNFAGVANTNGFAKVYVRNDATNSWIPTWIAQSTNAPVDVQVRSGIIYTDSITGQTLTFCGADDGLGWGGIYSGTYSTAPAAADTMGISWTGGPTAMPEVSISEVDANLIVASYNHTSNVLTVTEAYNSAAITVGTFIYGASMPWGCYVSSVDGDGTYTLSAVTNGGAALPTANILSETMAASIPVMGWFTVAANYLHVPADSTAKFFVTNNMIVWDLNEANGSDFGTTAAPCSITGQVNITATPALPGAGGAYTVANPPSAAVGSSGSPVLLQLCPSLPSDLLPRVMGFTAGSNGTQQITAGCDTSGNLNITAVQLASLGINAGGAPGTTVTSGSWNGTITAFQSGTEGGVGIYTVSPPPTTAIPAGTIMTATGASLFAIMGSQVWQRFDGSSPVWRPVWTKQPQATGWEFHSLVSAA